MLVTPRIVLTFNTEGYLIFPARRPVRRLQGCWRSLQSSPGPPRQPHQRSEAPGRPGQHPGGRQEHLQHTSDGQHYAPELAGQDHRGPREGGRPRPGRDGGEWQDGVGWVSVGLLHHHGQQPGSGDGLPPLDRVISCQLYRSLIFSRKQERNKTRD